MKKLLYKLGCWVFHVCYKHAIPLTKKLHSHRGPSYYCQACHQEDFFKICCPTRKERRLAHFLWRLRKFKTTL